MVGQLTLDQSIGVRILCPQPVFAHIGCQGPTLIEARLAPQVPGRVVFLMGVNLWLLSLSFSPSPKPPASTA